MAAMPTIALECEHLCTRTSSYLVAYWKNLLEGTQESTSVHGIIRGLIHSLKLYTSNVVEYDRLEAPVHCQR